MLEIKNIEFEILREKIVKNFSTTLSLGEVLTLFGPSGCGKTTILRLISGIETIKSGEIVNNFKKIAYIFQENRLLNNLNAIDNVLLCMQKPDKNKVLKYFNTLGFSKKDAYKFPPELSGGMAKRVSFLRAFLSGADLLLLDEPFVGLDMDLRNILVNLISKKLQDKEIACMLVTHDRFEAVMLSSEILFLSKKHTIIEKKLQITEELTKRDMSFIQNTLNTNFKGIVYYD